MKNTGLAGKNIQSTQTLNDDVPFPIVPRCVVARFGSRPTLVWRFVPFAGDGPQHEHNTVR